MSARPRRPDRRPRRGHAAVEMAMGVPLLMTLFVVILGVGTLAYNLAGTIHEARREAWSRRWTAPVDALNYDNIAVSITTGEAARDTPPVSPLVAGFPKPEATDVTLGSTWDYREFPFDQQVDLDLYRKVGQATLAQTAGVGERGQEILSGLGGADAGDIASIVDDIFDVNDRVGRGLVEMIPDSLGDFLALAGQSGSMSKLEGAVGDNDRQPPKATKGQRRDGEQGDKNDGKASKFKDDIDKNVRAIHKAVTGAAEKLDDLAAAAEELRTQADAVADTGDEHSDATREVAKIVADAGEAAEEDKEDGDAKPAADLTRAKSLLDDEKELLAKLNEAGADSPVGKLDAAAKDVSTKAADVGDDLSGSVGGKSLEQLAQETTKKMEALVKTVVVDQDQSSQDAEKPLLEAE